MADQESSSQQVLTNKRHTMEMRSSSKPKLVIFAIDIERAAEKQDSKSGPQLHSSPSCYLSTQTAVWRSALFKCQWNTSSVPSTLYTLAELLDKEYHMCQDSDLQTELKCTEQALVLCKWLIDLPGKKVGLPPLSPLSMYIASNEVSSPDDSGTVCYFLDHVIYKPVHLLLRPLTSSVRFNPDVGIVIGGLMVINFEINSSPMEQTSAKLAANLVDLLRCMRHFDTTSVHKITGFAFPNNTVRNYASKVTVEWKDLRFHVTQVLYSKEAKQSLKSDIVDAFNAQFVTTQVYPETYSPNEIVFDSIFKRGRCRFEKTHAEALSKWRVNAGGVRILFAVLRLKVLLQAYS